MITFNLFIFRVNSIYNPGDRMSFVFATCEPYSKEEYIKKFCHVINEEVWFKPLKAIIFKVKDQEKRIRKG